MRSPADIVPPPIDSAEAALVKLLIAADVEIAAVASAALPALKDAEVRKFAQMVAQDHRAGLTGAVTIGARLGYRVPADTMGRVAWLDSSSVTDLTFLEDQVDAGKTLLARLPTDKRFINDPSLQEHLLATRHAVQVHVKTAERISARLSADPSRKE